MSTEMKEYDLADYATYKVLHVLDEYREGYVPKSRFYKAIYLVSLSLMGRGVDICLPSRWYMYGPVVELDCVDPGAYSKEGSVSDDDELKERLFYGEEPSVHAPFDIVRTVDNHVDFICKPKPKLPKLMDNVYSTAPLPFMRVLRAYDDHVKSSMVRFTRDAMAFNVCETIRRRLCDEFPMDRYQPMFGSMLRVAELIRDSCTDARAFEVIKPDECSKEIRRSMGHGFSRDFHWHLPEHKVEKINSDYIRRIDTFDEFAFDKELAFYHTRDGHNSEYYEQEIQKLLG